MFYVENMLNSGQQASFSAHIYLFLTCLYMQLFLANLLQGLGHTVSNNIFERYRYFQGVLFLDIFVEYTMCMRQLVRYKRICDLWHCKGRFGKCSLFSLLVKFCHYPLIQDPHWRGRLAAEWKMECHLRPEEAFIVRKEHDGGHLGQQCLTRPVP